jgi:hypothetical protein
MMTFYLKLDGDIIVDILEFQYADYIPVELELPLPAGIYGGWYRWDGSAYHFDQDLYDHWMSIIEEENHA